MTILCFDISTGGVSAALFTCELELIKLVEDRWELTVDSRGEAVLPFETVQKRLVDVARRLSAIQLHPGHPAEGNCA